jgi:hypothetical protein
LKITITLSDYIGENGVAVSVEPNLHVLESAVGGEKLTPAAVYALGALNAMRAVQEGKVEFAVPRPSGKVKTISLPFTSVKEVTIHIDDKESGGVLCVSDPKFSTLAAMVAGGSKLTEVHRYALIALSRIYGMATHDRRGK